MKTFRLLIVLILICLVGFSIYYFFVDTLSFAQLSGKSKNPAATI